MNEKRYKIVSGILAVAIYFFLLFLILYYFAYHKSTKNQHFVDKSEKGIVVSLADSSNIIHTSPSHKKVRKRVKKSHKPSKIYSKHIKRVQKPRKKIDTKKLFSHIKIPSSHTSVKREKPSPKTAKSQINSSSIKREKKEKGIENRYLANVERLLRGWPAQVNFAGEEIDIKLTIYSDGSFDYKILRLSQNPDFNHALINYLKQLQGIGFGSHNRKRPYEIEVKFIAHQ